MWDSTQLYVKNYIIFYIRSSLAFLLHTAPWYNNLFVRKMYDSAWRLHNLRFVPLRHHAVWLLCRWTDEPFGLLKDVNIDGQHDGLGWPVDMAADAKQRCIYITDRYGVNSNPGLFRLGIDETYQHFPQDVTPGGLTLLDDGRLMVVCENKKEDRSLRFYRFSLEDGSWKCVHLAEMEILMPAVERYLLQPVMIQEDTERPDNTRIVLSQRHKSTNVHRIICIDGNGDEVRMLFSLVVCSQWRHFLHIL